MSNPERFPLCAALLVLSALLTWPPGATAGDDKWIEVRSAHFTVETPGSEKDGRKIADQFEQIRALFHSAFPTLRTDPGQAVVIVALKNEKGMKEYLPEQWETKGHLHAAGLYQGGFDKHYVVLQADAEGNNPYHALYHEYTHAMMHLNFANLPLWLDEGLAEYIGNASIGDKESRIGMIDPGNVYVLRQNRMLSIETLFAVDHSSPYYNETNRASIFYAESWALVHYLMVSPESRQKRLLNHFVEAWNTTHDALEAARQAFGDLKKFNQVLDSYIRVGEFNVGVVKNSTDGLDKQYATRSVSAAEVEALRGDFFDHHNRVDAGKLLLDDAVKQSPELAFAHTALAYYYYEKRDMPSVQKEAAEAIRLGDGSFIPPFLEGVSLQSGGIAGAGGGKDSLQQSVTLLSTSMKLNPNFAPASAALSNAYAIFPDKQAAAIGACIQAVKLDPTDMQYPAQLVRLLLNNNRYADAKSVSDRLVANAATPHEREMAGNLAQMVALRQQEQAEGHGNALASTAVPGTVLYRKSAQAGGGENSGAAAVATTSGGGRLSHFTVGTEGVLGEVDCSKAPEITLDLLGNGTDIEYHIADEKKVTITAPGNGAATACAQWSGQKVKLWFAPPTVPGNVGEVTKLEFQ